MTIYLYKKTHSITGLNYLGKTTQDPFKYKGSGVYWEAHLKVHGSDHFTEVLRECQSNEEVKKWGLYYSELWNVVESDKWANIKPENGDGGCIAHSLETRAKIKAANQVRDPAYKAILSARNKTRIITAEYRAKMSASQKGRIITPEHRAKLSAANKAYWERIRLQKKTIDN